MKRFAVALLVMLGLFAMWRYSAALGATPADKPADAPHVPDLGVGADMHGARPFPADDPWNTDISQAPVDPNSDLLIKSIGPEKPLHGDFGRDNGIPYVVVSKDQKKFPINFVENANESDKGPYPIPLNNPVEGHGRGDAHTIAIDRDDGMLYELYHAKPTGSGWNAGGGSIFNLKITSMQRPRTWTSCDAAGLPIFAGLVRYDEVMLRRKVEHAVRFTVSKSRRAYVPPARHQAGSANDPKLPPMGMRVRLKGSFNISRFPPAAQVILQGLKTYGMIVADNGSDWYITGAPDPRWNMEAISTLSEVKGKDFEVIRMDGLVEHLTPED